MCRYNLQHLFLLGNRLQLQKPTIANKNGRPSSFPRTINHPFRKKRIYFAEMCSFEPKMKGLKCIGTDLEKAIFNGFSSQINSLKLLLCVRHLQIKKEIGWLEGFELLRDSGWYLWTAVWHNQRVWPCRFKGSRRRLGYSFKVVKRKVAESLSRVLWMVL